MSTLLLAILVTIEFSILAIAFLVQPVDAGSTYWLSASWICLLVGINWFTSAAVFSGASKDGGKIETGSVLGALPAISIAILAYSTFSIVLMLFSSVLGVITWSFQYAIQVGAIALIASLTLVMLITVKGAQHGALTPVTKTEILKEIRRIQRVSTIGEITKATTEILNYVNSAMPHPAKLNSNNLKEVIRELENCDPNDSVSVNAAFNNLKKL
jgi:hypothetical protein